MATYKFERKLFSTIKRQKLFMLNNWTKDANGKWVKGEAIANGGGYTLTGPQAGTILGGTGTNGLVLAMGGTGPLKPAQLGTVKPGGATTLANSTLNLTLLTALTNNTNLKNTIANNNTLRLNNKAIAEMSPGSFLRVANNAKQRGFQNGLKVGFKQGQNSVGAFGGVKNTWNKWGTQGTTGRLKLAGAVAAGIGAASLMAKGVSSMFGNKNKDKDLLNL